MYCDLHNHLYGCLPAETLFRLGKNNPNPRWEIFLDSYEKSYGEKIRPESFFADYKDPKKFASLYHFQHKAPFLHFQAKFNLIIALVQFSEKEISEVSHDVTLDHARSKVSFAEYRLMFPKLETKESIYSKLMAAAEGLRLGEESSKKEGFQIQTKLNISLHRDFDFERHYDWLKNWIEKDKFLRSAIVGIDFCHIEEGFPPKTKKDFFQTILKDNKAEPDTAIAILYHVGESFRDKTPKSAVRWILEAGIYGAHRLGHALALGISPDHFLGEERTELVSEAMEQVEWELENYEKIIQFGPFAPKESLEEKHKQLLGRNRKETILIPFDESEARYLKTFQEYAMDILVSKQTVIECCPSSNHYIGMLESWKDHPISRFIEHGLRVTIGSDDPGLFGTTMEQEYQRASMAGLSDQHLEDIKQKSFFYTSEKLSGRESG